MEPTEQVANRKLFELRQKLESIRSELDEWQRRSRAGGPLEKHHTQIRRVTDQLASLQQVVSRRLDGLAGDAAGVLGQAREVEGVTLELHRIWDFFRGKFALRSVDWFSPFLLAADEFAWASYDAARKKLRPGHLREDAIKEPPLVFFSGSVSPFTLPRESTYEAERVEDEQVSTAEFREVLRSLPIPVIGIPWVQVRHLPDALSIAHEVGHIVEADFGLTLSLEYNLDREMNYPSVVVDVQRQEAWRAWLGEIFADVFGCLIAGPAYVGSLIDFLILSEEAVSTETREAPSWGEYPTAHLRAQLNLEVLRRLAFEREAVTLRAHWLGVYPRHALPEFDNDIPHVVKGVLLGAYTEFGGLTLQQGIAFTRQQHATASLDASRVLERYGPESDDIRTLFVTARLAFEWEPEAYVAARAQESILRRVPQIQQPGFRGGGDEGEALAQKIQMYDKSVGQNLYEMILRRLPGRLDAGEAL